MTADSEHAQGVAAVLEHAATIETELASVARNARASDHWEGLPFGQIDVSPASYEPIGAVVSAQSAQQTTAAPSMLATAPTAAAAGSEVGWGGG